MHVEYITDKVFSYMYGKITMDVMLIYKYKDGYTYQYRYSDIQNYKTYIANNIHTYSVLELQDELKRLVYHDNVDSSPQRIKKYIDAKMIFNLRFSWLKSC